MEESRRPRDAKITEFADVIHGNHGANEHILGFVYSEQRDSSNTDEYARHDCR